MKRWRGLRPYFLCSVVLLMLMGCRSGQKGHRGNSDTFPIQYAHDFRVERTPEYTLVEVFSPWDTLQVLQRYVLVDRTVPLPADLPAGTLVRTPLQRVAVYSSVHCSMLEELGVADRIVGVCEPNYIELDFVREGVAQGTIADLGEGASPDVEKMMIIAPEAIITAPFKNVGYGRVEKTGILLLECVDYLEATPLGRAEWIRFLALFFGKETLADSLFQRTAAVYDSLCTLITPQMNRPTVLSEMKYGAVWYMPGGRSYVSNLFRDAGANYLWKEDQNTGSIPLSFETVFERGEQVDCWIIKYNAQQDLTYEGLQNEFEPYGHFAAFKKRNIFVCNTGKIPYYEEFPMHPDRVLRNLIWVFHPELLPDYRPRYFSKMKE